MLLLIPLLPFLGFLVNAGVGRRLSKAASGAVACGVMLGPFVVSLAAVTRLVSLAPESRAIVNQAFTWIASGDFTASFALRLDPLSAVMILVVTGIGSLIHIYSTAYMHEESDSEYARYFSYLNLFASFMLVLVLGANFLVMFVGWEGVGLCSYLLIGFWFEKRSASDAGKKAFIVNRIGDFGFVLGVLLAFVRFGTIDFQQIARAVAPMSPDAGLGADPRGDDGDGGRLHDRAQRRSLRARAGDADGGGRHRHGDRADGRHDCARAERHQTRARVLDRVAARLHVPGDGRRRVCRRDLPPLH